MTGQPQQVFQQRLTIGSPRIHQVSQVSTGDRRSVKVPLPSCFVSVLSVLLGNYEGRAQKSPDQLWQNDYNVPPGSNVNFRGFYLNLVVAVS